MISITNQQIALSLHLKCRLDELTCVDEHTYEYKLGNTQRYLVYTDNEADEFYEEWKDNYIDDVVLSEIPDRYRNYFDNDKYKEALDQDGRGSALSGYDGSEEYIEVEIDGTTYEYYIYREN